MSDFLPVVLALAAALLVAIAQQVQNLGVKKVDSQIGTAVAIGASVVTLWLFAPFKMKWEYWLEPAVVIFAVAGLFRPVLSANLTVLGLRHLGPTLTSSLSATSPLFGVVLGIAILGENLNLGTSFGVLGIVVAVMILTRKEPTLEKSWPVWALFMPVLGGAVRSGAHVLSKLGMETVPDPYFATLVGFTVSLVVAVAVLQMRKSKKCAENMEAIPFSWKERGVKCFALSGAIFGIAMLCFNAALLNGEVVTVIPIVASSPIFSMLLSMIFFKGEKLTRRVVLTVLMVFVSVVLIAVSRH